MENIKQIISNNLTALRKSRKMTQAELGEKINYSDKAISRWEKGEALPDIDILCQLCEFYGVSFQYLTTEKEIQANIVKREKKERSNKAIIVLLAVSFIFFVATSLYVYLEIIFNKHIWNVFVWATPISVFITFIFNLIWGKRKWSFVLISVFVWCVLACIYIQFLQYNLWMIFILGVPPQISIILWSQLKRHKKKD